MAGKVEQARKTVQSWAGKRTQAKRERTDGWLRQTFSLPREEARDVARAFLARYPKAAYASEVESWRALPDGSIEFTMRRLPSAD